MRARAQSVYTSHAGILHFNCVLYHFNDPLNSQELGMFMSCLTIVGNNGDPINKICKSSILEFK